MIKLCYKEYDWKVSNEALKSFYDKTGLDLTVVFGDYISAWMNMSEGLILFDKMQVLAKLHSRKTASLALHCIIKAANERVSLDEIEDATFRVNWILSDRPDDLSEPWPFVMFNTAIEINEYYNANIPKKKAKADTSES